MITSRHALHDQEKRRAFDTAVSLLQDLLGNHTTHLPVTDRERIQQALFLLTQLTPLSRGEDFQPVRNQLRFCLNAEQESPNGHVSHGNHVYTVMLLLSRYWPVNRLSEDPPNFECDILYEPIDAAHRVISVQGRQYHQTAFPALCKALIPSDPFNRMPFLPRDMAGMRHQYNTNAALNNEPGLQENDSASALSHISRPTLIAAFILTFIAICLLERRLILHEAELRLLVPEFMLGINTALALFATWGINAVNNCYQRWKTHRPLRPFEADLIATDRLMLSLQPTPRPSSSATILAHLPSRPHITPLPNAEEVLEEEREMHEISLALDPTREALHPLFSPPRNAF